MRVYFSVLFFVRFRLVKLCLIGRKPLNQWDGYIRVVPTPFFFRRLIGL